MAFPKPPFKIDSAADAVLVKYLRADKNFSFLRPSTRKKIRKLDAGDLRVQDPRLLTLWPHVLVDALRTLKRHDPREWDLNNPRVNYGSFFHEGSLGVTELRKLLESFANFEGLLYGSSPDRYRDHIAHTFRVWIIGHGILKNQKCLKGLLFSDELLDGKKKRDGQMMPSGKISPQEWECMWAIVALCHDLGYPISHVDKINSIARDALGQMGLVPGGDLRFSFSQQMLPFHETLIRLMASKPVKKADGSYSTHLQNKYYLKLFKSFDNLDHGIISSLLVSKALVYFLESDLAHDDSGTLNEEDARQFLIRREILRAIAAHTCQDIYHLRFDTLSFLLYLVDEIQCWGRPTLEELQHQPSSLPESEGKVVAFNPTSVAVTIETGPGTWSTDDRAKTKNQLGKLQRMLRLAVNTSMLSEHYLRFAVMPKKGKGWQLLLKQGRLVLKSVDIKGMDRIKA